ncbi:TlpA family protein disulfide reductase [Chondromyces apiculatus]|uniref:Thioredoxin n=1 Tax=Chondromyces apiculatus DSM 436 TaxID=1192034 RepID=A0A017T5K4_9BACT|nr:TlpA disulfide reductase family protein [Chondromyces apiculatus]EYF04060.1 thioredoxin [Chondromyces apiculatus DSM 436]
MKLAKILQLVFIAAAAFVVFGFVRAAQKDHRRTQCTALCALKPTYANHNRTAPDFELPDMTGRKVRLSSYRGKTVFLNFWTKTCAPCLEEMPALADLARLSRGRKDFVVLTVSTDEGPDAVRDTLKVALGGEPPFPVLFDPESSVVADVYGTKLFPETWIIDPSGIIRARFDGPRDWSDALAVEIGEMISRPGTCPVEFFKGTPSGPFASICEDDT